jgi:hypothetical protein
MPVCIGKQIPITGNQAFGPGGRVVEIVVIGGDTPILICQRVLVKFMKPGDKAAKSHASSSQAPIAR